MVENEIGKILKCLKSDNGGEYSNNEFEDDHPTNGIHRQKLFQGFYKKMEWMNAWTRQ